MRRELLSIACLLMLASPTYASDGNNQPDLNTSKENAPDTGALESAATENKTATTGEKEPSSWEKILAKMPKFSGYLQTGWNYNSAGNHTSSFQAKRLRLIMDANVISKVSVRLQIEAFNGISGSTNGNGQKNIQVMDAFATANITPVFKIRAGQYYLPLGYENYDISPATLETVDFSNICYRMVCRNAISYNIVDYGRDLGVMVFGDLFSNADQGFSYLSYNLSLSNGSIPMKDDNNKSKDLVAAIEIRPIKLLNIKASYNWGEYNTSLGGATDENGVALVNQDMNRFIVGAWYNDPMGLDLRAEYGHIAADEYVKEDGFYALAAYHIGKWLPVVRYDLYRDKVNTTTANNYNRILAGLTYELMKNLKIQCNVGYSRYTDDAKDAIGKSGATQIQLMGMFKF